MLKKILPWLFSTKISLLLLIGFAVSMAVATFIENDHGTPVARALVYEAWWFEVIMVWLAINFSAHIKKYNLFSKERWPIGLFHIAFIITIIGSGVTRYFSREGTIHIREGQTQNSFFTTERYLQIRKAEDDSAILQEPLTLVPHQFEPSTISRVIDQEKVDITFDSFIPHGTETFIDGADTLFSFAYTTGGSREDFILRNGGRTALGAMSLALDANTVADVKIFKSDSGWVIQSSKHLQVMEMATQKIAALHEGSIARLQVRTLYQWNEGAFLVKEIHEGATIAYIPVEDEMEAKNYPEVLKLNVADEAGVALVNGHIAMSTLGTSWLPFEYDGRQYEITYGPKSVVLPFSLKLNKFEMERYPGSQSPSSYASEVQVVDDDDNYPYRIYMNNVLDHKGYRFYQASYDTDEKGTVLSVNQDRPGTYLTYLGYTLMGIGMFITLFAKGSRFRMLTNRLNKLKASRTITTILLLLLYQAAFAQSQRIPVIPERYADAYGQLIVQDLDGRMKPLNTLAQEIARKISGKSKITIDHDSSTLELTPEQFLLALQLDPQNFSTLAIIKIDKEKSTDVFSALGLIPAEKVSFMNFLDENSGYRLHEKVEAVNKLKPANRNEADKELLKTDERFNIFYALLTGDFLRLFPNRKDPGNTWFTATQWQQGFDEEDARFVKNITNMYLAALAKGLNTNDWKDAEEALSYIQLYQQKAGASVYPDAYAVKAELLYNKINLGNRLFGWFWLVGLSLLVMAIVMLFKQSKKINYAWTIGVVLAWIGFLLFCFHLGLRWYIAQHPPWSDGFEMLVFVAWGVLLFGLLFNNKTRFSLPLGLLFSGTLLFVAFLDWLNPEITNLMPVLHSYWLKIHVAVIVSSYAPLALAAIMALLSLIFIIVRPNSNDSKWKNSLEELQLVNEMAVTIGLFLLAIGTFLGGVWANESWGRYWAWDPKETWALISVMVYAIVLHLRLIPALNHGLVYNLASMWAFSSIVMTSFGVNYYLSGLHSYAKGDPVPVPGWVYWVGATLLIISVAAYWRDRQARKLKN